MQAGTRGFAAEGESTELPTSVRVASRDIGTALNQHHPMRTAQGWSLGGIVRQVPQPLRDALPAPTAASDEHLEFVASVKAIVSVARRTAGEVSGGTSRHVRPCTASRRGGCRSKGRFGSSRTRAARHAAGIRSSRCERSAVAQAGEGLDKPTSEQPVPRPNRTLCR